MKTVSLSLLTNPSGKVRKKRKHHVLFSWVHSGREFLCGLLNDQNYEVEDYLPVNEAEAAWRESLPPGLCIGCKNVLKHRLRAGPLDA